MIGWTNKAAPFIESEIYGQPSTRRQGNGKTKNDFQTTENVVPAQIYLFDSTFVPSKRSNKGSLQ